MNWIWIILLLCCCNGNNGDGCIQPRNRNCENEYDRRDYLRAPFAPECDRDCGCRTSERECESCEE